MNKVEVKTIFEGYGDKEKKRSHLAHSRPGLNYMKKILKTWKWINTLLLLFYYNDI